MRNIFCIHLSINGHLDCFHILSIVNILVFKFTFVCSIQVASGNFFIFSPCFLHIHSGSLTTGVPFLSSRRYTNDKFKCPEAGWVNFFQFILDDQDGGVLFLAVLVPQMNFPFLVLRSIFIK